MPGRRGGSKQGVEGDRARPAALCLSRGFVRFGVVATRQRSVGFRPRLHVRVNEACITSASANEAGPSEAGAGDAGTGECLRA